MLRSFVQISVLLAVPVVPVRAQAPDTASMRHGLAAAFDTTRDWEPRLASFTQQLPVIERATLAFLDRGESPRAINTWLASLPGFAGPSAGQSTRIGDAVFFQSLARGVPSYFITQLAETRSDILVLVLDFPWVNGSSRISVFRRRDARWTDVGALASDRQLELYPLIRTASRPVLATFERYWRADGSEGTLRFWAVTGTSLVPVTDTSRSFEDPNIACTDSTVVLQTYDFPSHLGYSIMGPRDALERTYRVERTRVVVVQRELTPWVSLVDSLYGLLDGGRVAAARGLVVRPAFVDSLRTHEPLVSADSGGLAAGAGEVEVSWGPNHYWRVRSGRQSDGSWRIVRLVRGTWVGDHVEWSDGRRTPS